MTHTPEQKTLRDELPDRIWLLEMELGEWVWCDDPSPDYEDRRTVEYVRMK